MENEWLFRGITYFTFHGSANALDCVCVDENVFACVCIAAHAAIAIGCSERSANIYVTFGACACKRMMRKHTESLHAGEI